MRIIGIDPGLTGALAVLGPDGLLEQLDDLPVIRDRSLAWIDGVGLRTLLGARSINGTIRAVIERAHAMPKNGCAGAFSQGCTLGSILAVVQTAGFPIELVSPATWKRALGLITSGAKLSDRERKQASLDKARLLYPDADLSLIKHHGRAEALLLAHYARTRGHSE